MQIVYNSEQFYIVAYPAEEAYEVIDKTAGRGSFFGGDLAHRFHDSMRDMAAKDPSTEALDDFIANFGLPLTLPAVYH
jgi:Protein of unknown function (DUF3567)